MKKKVVTNLAVISCISISTLFISASVINTVRVPGSIINSSYVDEDIPADQLIIWQKPGKSQKEYNEWLNKLRKKHGIVIEKSNCGSCDNSLRLLSGPGIKTFIQTDAVEGKVTSGVTSPLTGEDGPVYYCRNYRVRHKKPNIPRITLIEKPIIGINAGNPVKVAVFDTGLDPAELVGNYSYHTEKETCIKGSETGWNFVGNNKNYGDDDNMKHGTIVTRLITEQVFRYKKNRIEILPVKTHDANGVGDLYNILCAFAYANKMGVQVINASFGFYTPRHILSPEDDPFDPNALLLRKYVKHYLTEKKIILVTAAGNSDNINLKKTFDAQGWPYKPNDPQDLNQVSFLPASLARSRDFPNVIAVTTVYINKNGNGAVSPDQNFSEDVVDIGVNADATFGKDYVFTNPILNNKETIEGSSFAAPIVTGMLCANYDRIKAVIFKKNFRKEDIWKELGAQFVKTNQTLKNKIKDGKVIDRLR